MDLREYNKLKNLVDSVNWISSSPYKVSIVPKRDDDSLHALVHFNKFNRIAFNLFEVLKFSRVFVGYDELNHICKYYFK